MPQENLQELTRLMRETMEELSPNAGPFRPTIFYNPPLDTIELITRDCSILEETPNKLGLSFLKDNLENHELVGLFLWNAKHFCRTHGIMNTTQVQVDALLDALASFSDQPEREMIEKLRLAFPEGAAFKLFQ